MDSNVKMEEEFIIQKRLHNLGGCCASITIIDFISVISHICISWLLFYINNYRLQKRRNS